MAARFGYQDVANYLKSAIDKVFIRRKTKHE